MRALRKLRLLACLLSLWVAFYPLRGAADDIDIFVGGSAGTKANPNVLIVLDNTSNWARQSQQWPGGEQQGQSEVSAISTVIQSLPENVNVGMMEFVTGSGATNNGGFIRYAIQPMTVTNKTNFSNVLTTIYNGVNSPDEKRSSNTPYGNLMWDVYNYFAGANQSQGGAATLATLADSNGYTSNYGTFKSPVNCGTNCAKNFIIFISNPNASGPASDDATNTSALSGLGGSTTQLGLPNFTTTTTPTVFPLYQTNYCYGSQAACNTGEAVNSQLTSQCPPTTTGNYTSCSCAAANDPLYPALSTLAACPAGQQRYSVIGTNNSQTTGPTIGTQVVTTANSSACYANAQAAATSITAGADTGGLTCPAATTVTVGNVTTRTTYSCSYTAGVTAGSTTGCGAAPVLTSRSSSTCYGSSTAASNAVAAGTERGGLVCPVGYTCTYSMTGQAASDSCTSATAYTLGSATNLTAETQTAATSSCYTGVSTGNNKWSDSTDHAGLTCPAATSTTTVSGSTVSQKSYPGTCSYSGADGASCTRTTEQILVTQSTTPTQQTATVHNYVVQQSATVVSGTVTAHYTVTQTATPSITVTTTGTFNTTLGTTLQCYSSLASCSTADFAGSCALYSNGCSCSATGATSAAIACPSGQSYEVTGTSNVITNTPTGTYTTDNNPFNADEWSRFLFKKGVPAAPDPATGLSCDNLSVATYTIDVYNAQPNAQNTALMTSMARTGGGKYFNATNKQAIINALKQIFVEIQAVNSTFASASLPINATNRAQNANQVFIGMFRPDPDMNPRWFGNVKRYQLVLDATGTLQLGDLNGNLAINTNTGFLTACATSWWTSNSPNAPGRTDNAGYWSAYTVNPDPEGQCGTSVLSPYSDSPDGPQVEKGAVAEVLRKGNNPTTTDATPTWAVNRTVYTAIGDPPVLASFDTTNTPLSSTTVNWVLGQDTQDENANGNTTETRATIHGDVVHSRPLPVNYCTTANCLNVVTYYGSNDGTLRAVDANTGKEKWAFVAPEFNSTLDRLRVQSPLVNYPGATFPAGLTPTPTRRNYFFDGSLGIYQTIDNSKVWIFPTMRRGGRMIYALDVTDSSNPVIKWKFGCDALSGGTCTTSHDLAGMPSVSNIGQTWSIPNVGFIKGYSTTTPVVVVGGGYDSCEDDDTSAPSCGSTTGNVVYVLNAATGNVVAAFSTLRSVAADPAMIDMDFDGYVDYAYIADTGGNLYRINFASFNNTTLTVSTQTSSQWTIQRIAYTNGAGRKFLFAPSLFGAKGVVYIALGSGDREHPLERNYPYQSSVANRFYVYRELLPSPSPVVSSTSGGDNLDDTTLMNQTSATNPAPCDAPQTTAANAATNKGWFLDLDNGRGEQTVTSAVITGGMVTWSTNRPLVASAASCANPLGEARGYFVDLFKGSGAIATQNNATCGGVASGVFVGGGLPPSPVVGTVTVGGVPQSVVIGAIQRSGEVSSPISPQKATATNLPARKRVYTVIKGDN